MLPYFLEQDLADVLHEQNAAGYPLQWQWFAPRFEFRVPKHGDFATRGVEVELRPALEPRHVMGAEGAIGGTLRYVDPSVERMGFLRRGHTPTRVAVQPERPDVEFLFMRDRRRESS